MQAWFEQHRQRAHGLGLLLLRFSVGGMMLTHGMPKLWRLAAGATRFADPLGLGQVPSLALTVFAEVVCAALLIAGAKTRFAAAPLLFTMLVAAFIVHGGDPFKKQELALLYAAGSAALLLLGAGPFSVDAWLEKRASSRGPKSNASASNNEDPRAQLAADPRDGDG
jgi:putative oxidoreductase